MQKIFLSLLATAILSGCAAQRAVVAQDAQTRMIGLSKEQVLTCMGAPAAKNAEAETEVWTYNTGNGHTSVATFSNVAASATSVGNTVYGSGFGNSLGVASTRYCIVNVVMTGGRVSRVNYSGPTGGLITSGEQCAFAVQNCMPNEGR
ncbi:hypothetical protein [Rhodomicrobium lacus]|uniref:hypothetical protein n=1 Tax=Rhodomicrobium lacus TaxID=2498452 RepID=UPI0026E3DABA|nr:hypothetical protein [Rhodomicrobium lacus]WKW49793.1 hypothetical protein QMO75_10840 [Rhodomicrobium lacus]